MKRRLTTTVALIYCFTVCLAATITDLNGSWTGTISVDGNNYTENFVFRVDGDRLTGTTYEDQDDPKPINPGTVNGADLTFSVSNKDGETLQFTGKYYTAGDSVSLNTDFAGQKVHLLLKRSADK
ncbi:MAG: hypothetical protein ACHQHN_00525 [Sphingobacteriales bacterium]